MPPMHGRMMAAGQHPEKADLGAIKKILIYCKRYLPALIAAIIFAIGGSVATIIGPEKISDLMNEITKGIMTGIDMDAFEKICFTLVAIYVTGAILSYAQQFITATVTQNTARRLRRDIDTKINRLPLRYFDTTTKGDLLSRVTNDVDTISQTLSSSSANLISSLALFFGVIYKMFRTNAVLATVTIVSSLVGFVFMGLILKKSQVYFNRKQSDLGAMNGHIEEIYTNHNIVRAFGAKNSEHEKFGKINGRLYDSNWKSQFLSGMMMPMMNFVGNLAYALIFIVGVAFIVNGNTAVTLGTIMSFVIYAKLFSQPLSTFAQSMTSIQQASAASKRVFDLLEAQEQEDESRKTAEIKNVRGEVEFRNVKFGYLPDKTIIHDFSVKLGAGKKIAIVGPTGAGKTTMVNLLMRFYDVDSGSILLSGRDIADYSRASTRDRFGMVLQDTWLFGGTIAENVAFGKPDATREEIIRACDEAYCDHFIRTLPQGYDTVIGSDTSSISSGQKQLLTIARALLAQRELLILDEATSNVDTRTELLIQKAMDRLMRGRTCFIIAHRLSTIVDADLILVLRDGRIVEQGKHRDLLEKKGFYYEIYKSQYDIA